MRKNFDIIHGQSQTVLVCHGAADDGGDVFEHGL